MLRDLRAEQRVLARGENDGAMPSLAHITRARVPGPPTRAPSFATTHRTGEARDSFEEAATRSPTEPPDLLAAFARAAQQRREREQADGKAPGLDPARRNVSAGPMFCAP